MLKSWLINLKLKVKTSEIKKIIKPIQIVVLVFLITVLAFRGWSIFQVQKTVTEYNQRLSTVYEQLDIAPIKGIISKDEEYRISMVVRNYVFKQQKPKLSLDAIDFVSISWGLKNVKVITTENWTFTLMDMKMSRIEKPVPYWYRMRYDLLRQGFKWKVEKVRIIEERKK